MAFFTPAFLYRYGKEISKCYCEEILREDEEEEEAEDKGLGDLKGFVSSIPNGS